MMLDIAKTSALALTSGAAFIIGGYFVLAFGWGMNGPFAITLMMIGKAAIGWGIAHGLDMLRDPVTPPHPFVVGACVVGALTFVPG